MKRHTKQRDAASETLIALRTAMKMTQAQFAVMVLDTAVTTIARYETTHPPKGDLLIRLAQIAEKQGLIELRNVFRKLYFIDAKRELGFDLMAMGTEGYLLLELDGDHAIRGAQSFMLVVAQLASSDPKIKQNAVAALSSLQAAARQYVNPAVSEIQDAFLSVRTRQQLQPSTKQRKLKKSE